MIVVWPTSFVGLMGLWQEESKLVLTDGSSCDEFGYYVALSGEKYIIGSPLDDYMGY